MTKHITMTSKLKQIIPFIILLALFSMLFYELFYSKPNELPSALIGEPVPHFQLASLSMPQKIFTQKDLLGHGVVLLNVFAAWCYACSLEQPMLMKIKEQYHIPIYGIDYKDTKEAATNWLRKNGNPYILTGTDKSGDVAIDLGVYGTPETFIISPNGHIVYRHVGTLDQKTWDEVLYPLVKKYAH